MRGAAGEPSSGGGRIGRRRRIRIRRRCRRRCPRILQRLLPARVSGSPGRRCRRLPSLR